MDRERQEAIRIAREAGRRLMRFYGRATVEWKSKNDPVTEADHAANDYILAELRQSFPDDGILSEETEDDRLRLQRSRVWIIDPLDGTREFIAQNGEFAVMIGLAVEGRAVLGAVYRPVDDVVFAGQVGRGAVAVRDAIESPLLLGRIAEDAPLRAVVSRSHREGTTDQILDALGIAERVHSGSVGLKVAALLESRAEVYVAAYEKFSEWDTCAPEAILRAAGGEFTDLFGDPMEYNRNDPRNRRGLCGTRGGIHERVVEVARPIAQKAGLGGSVP